MIRMTLVIALVLAAAQQTTPRFDPIQPELFRAGGAFVNAWADYDDDFAVDVFVGFNGTTPNRLYRNELRRNGTFRDVAPLLGLAESRAVRAAAWADFDGDSHLDLLVGYTPGTSSLLKLYRNNGSAMMATAGPNGPFVDVTEAAGLTVMTGAVRQPVFVDFDGDGDLDLFVAFRDRANAMFRNTGGHFVDVAKETGLADGRKSVGAVWFDYDQDGDLDLYVANMDGDANGLFRNDDGHFVDVAAAAGVAWGGRAPNDPASGTVRPCVADVNNDGRFDIFTANYGPNGLFLAKPDHTFADASHQWGVDITGHYDTCIFGDINNDGRVDVYVNGTITGGVQYPDYLLVNTGTRFEDRTPANIRAINADHGAAWVDADRDGALDLSLTGSQPDGMHSLLRNLTPDAAAHSVMVAVTGGRASPQAGAEVRAYKSGTRQLVASGLVDSGSGYDMQNALPVHLGIGALTETQVTLEVTWPASGHRMTKTVAPWKSPKGMMGGWVTHVTTPRVAAELLFPVSSGEPLSIDRSSAWSLPPGAAAAVERYTARLKVFKPRVRVPPGYAGVEHDIAETRQNIERNVFGLFGDPVAAAAVANALRIPYEWEGSAGPPLGEAESADRYLAAHPASIAAPFLHVFSARLKICALNQTDDLPPAGRIAEIRTDVDRQLDAAAASGHALLKPVALFLKEARVCGVR